MSVRLKRAKGLGAARVDGRATIVTNGLFGLWDARNVNGDGSSPSHGSMVSSWVDLSGGGYHFTQTTDANKPVMSATGGPSGGPCVAFDGSNDWMRFMPPSQTARTWYVLYRLRRVADNRVIYQYDGADGCYLATQSPYTFAFFPTAVLYNVPTNAGSWYYDTLTMGTASQGYRNGVSIGSYTENAPTTAGDYIYLGSDKIPSNYAAVDVAFVACYNVQHTADERAQMWAYITQQFLTPPATTLPTIGDFAYDGFYAGIIDTTVGNIIAADHNQNGKRYMLFMYPRDLTGLAIKTGSAAADPTGCRTRWDGLGATVAMNAAGAAYAAAQYVLALPYPNDGGSPWYIPAMDELDVVYRAFKPVTYNNRTESGGGTGAGTFPFNGSDWNHGVNPSSDPTGSAYTTSVPGQTSLPRFQAGQDGHFPMLGTSQVWWTCTEYNDTYTWQQACSYDATYQSEQAVAAKSSTVPKLRPVRRVYL